MTGGSWEGQSQQALGVALEEVRVALQRYCGADGSPEQNGKVAPSTQSAVPSGGEENDVEPSVASALEHVRRVFALTPFETSVLALCAGTELEPDFPQLCAAANGDPRMNFPTAGLAMALFPEAQWSALSPASTLRRWRLIEPGAGERLTGSPLRIDERVLHQLLGAPYLDERLQGLIEPVAVPLEIPASQQPAVWQAARAWAVAGNLGAMPVIQLCGNDAAGKRAVAAVVCQALGLQLRSMRPLDLPAACSERNALMRLWEREALLSNCALLMEDEDAATPDLMRNLASFLESTQALLLVMGREPLRLRKRRVVRVDIDRPNSAEQKAIWGKVLGEARERLNGHVDAVATQFDLGLQSIFQAGEEALQQCDGSDGGDLGTALWEACRRQARPSLDDLAQRIQTSAVWDDLVLPAAQMQVLRSIAAHVRQRALVYDGWGFGSQGTRGLGISALFSGASGTGKTLAAEVLANELHLDLYRIDLSAMVSKYIGETEKNLRRVFDAAEEGGAILLFDEADALFGKRSEVKDSHDRYANIEVSYLLQRIESYRGLAVLTSNLKNAVDAAFLRRIRFIVHFPFPDTEQRMEIWRRVFPRSAPVDGLDTEKLARLNLSGGNIRNLALNAAFLAADAAEPVGMKHLLVAAQAEYAKLEKPLSAAETRGWV